METALLGVGDHPALEFLNTVATPGTETIEVLADGDSYLQWLEAVGLLERAERAAARDTFSDVELDRVAAEACELREQIRTGLAMWAGGARPTVPKSLRPTFTEILAADHRYLELANDGSTVAERRRWDHSRQLLIPPVEATVALMTSGDQFLTRRCEGLGCTLWFYDRTKAHRRRWCSMAICGNRAKARAHRERQRGD